VKAAQDVLESAVSSSRSYFDSKSAKSAKIAKRSALECPRFLALASIYCASQRRVNEVPFRITVAIHPGRDLLAIFALLASKSSGAAATPEPANPK
jgi:hypothetical protein